jgi:hypothetical protein
MQKVSQILKNFKPVEDKYISREFQSFGIHLSEELDDYKHRGLYIRLAKTVHRAILERALSFVSDSNAKNKGALFMWKLKQLRGEKSSVASTSAKALADKKAMEGKED